MNGVTFEQVPLKKKLEAMVALCGTRAKTLRGQVKAIKGIAPTVRRKYWDRVRVCNSNINSIRRNLERRRCLTPEIREAYRARADKAYRRNWMRRMRRLIATTARYDRDTLRGITDYQESQADRFLQLDKINKWYKIADACRSQINPNTKLEILKTREDIAMLRVGTIEDKYLRKIGVKLDMRAKGARVLPTLYNSYLYKEAPVTKWTTSGKPYTVRRAIRENMVRSFALLKDAKTIDVALHTIERTLTLPDGYEWRIDQYGLCMAEIRNTDNNYHPDALDLIGDDWFNNLRSKIEELKEKRKIERIRLKADKADAEGVWVCLRDSLRAGNCHMGTLAWAQNHRLDAKKHYRATELLDMDGSGRLRLAVSAAIYRHRQEMKQGYALLENHA